MKFIFKLHDYDPEDFVAICQLDKVTIVAIGTTINELLKNVKKEVFQYQKECSGIEKVVFDRCEGERIIIYTKD